ncbi:hypothetical protein D3C77_15730 [compost metagenome]
MVSAAFSMIGAILAGSRDTVLDEGSTPPLCNVCLSEEVVDLAPLNALFGTLSQNAGLRAFSVPKRPQKWGKQHKRGSFFVAPYLALKLFQYIDLQVDY